MFFVRILKDDFYFLGSFLKEEEHNYSLMETAKFRLKESCGFTCKISKMMIMTGCKIRTFLRPF